MLLKIGLGIVGVVAIILVLGAFQPAEYVVSRSTSIKAPIEKIWPYLNNQKLGDEWGPWGEVDPKATMVHSGPDEGVGAKTSWDSPGQLGTGSATITETVPNQRVRIALEYTKPWVMNQISDYIVETKGDETTVTWRVEGHQPYMGRVAGLFFNMDKTVGKFFEQGLAKLKTLAEKAP